MDNIFYAVVVTFNPDVDIVAQTECKLNKQGFKTIVIDNGSYNVIELQDKIKNAEIICNGENKGIAYALNKGIEKAADDGAEWVLTLDQDSQVADNLLEEYKKHLDIPRLGALCPRVIRKGKRDQIEEREEVLRVEICPTAGFFQSIKSWKDVGGYDEWMFIDYVDYDMCMRIKRTNNTIYRVNTTYVIQDLGKMAYNERLYKFAKKMKWNKLENFSVTYNHSPMRNYYYVRNGLYYIDNFKDILDARSERTKILKWELKKLILEKNRVKNTVAIFRGIVDYRKRKRTR